MATIDINTFQSSANLNLWLKVYTGDPLTLADIPEVIPLRWTYFRDNWQFLKNRLLNMSTVSFDSDYYRSTLDDLTDFINKQRLNTTDKNPFASNDIYYRFYPIFDTMKLEQLTLTNEEQSILKAKKAAVQAFSKGDFLDIKQTIKNYRDHVSDLIGLNDPSYDQVYGRSSVKAQGTASIADLNLLQVLQNELTSVNFVLANLFAVDTAVDPFALARANANNPEIDIGQYKAGYLVKLNYGEDLAGLAKRFLKNADKWLDIAIANGLKEPYVDEIGQQLYLLANGNGNQINIAEFDLQGNPNINKFYVNQLILIQSNTIPYPNQRMITGIKQVPVSGEIVLTLNGGPTLNNYKLADAANIRVFKPNTVNSNHYILIPSKSAVLDARQEEIPWFLASAPADEKKMKVDIAFGANGEMLKTPTGDIALSYGLANAIQAITIKLQTELGANARHPALGIINLVGGSTATAEDAKNALVTSINAQIQADKRFDRVENISIQRDLTAKGVVYLVNLSVKLAGSTTVVPITFTVPT